jgi:ABC-type uncharacterized transport system substrate-binding protein
VINRRDLLFLLCAAALAPQTLRAQAKQPVLIGWLNGGARESHGHFLAAFRDGLAAAGWKEGSQVAIVERWANGRTERLPALARELAAKEPLVIVAAPSLALRPAATAAPTTPIVQASGASPVERGLAASLARPGGMVTGVTNIALELSEKYLELMIAAAPTLKRIGFMSDPTTRASDSRIEAARRSAVQHSVEARFAEARRPEEIEAAIARLEDDGAQALVVFNSPTFTTERRRIVKLALARRWPVVSGFREWADEGALLSYGVDTAALYRRSAYYVDRILKGAKPGDLPIEQPTKFELVVNLKTANALGLTLPQPFLMRADRVIE